MTSLGLLLIAAGAFALSGVVARRLGLALSVAATIVGAAGVTVWWLEASPPAIELSWAIPGSVFSLGFDALSAAFVLPVLVIPTLATIYGHAYFSPSERTFRRTRCAFGLVPASMIVVVLARDAFLLLVAWEVMALASFLLVAADDDEAEVRASAWVYLVSTHVGTVCLLAGFAGLGAHTGSLQLVAVQGLAGPAVAGLSLLFLVGFGTKAGVMPLHFWLPGAHANAPTPVSALMSGVVIKMGLYGLMRMASLLRDLPAEAGGVLLVIGALAAIVGAALALTQSDLKRLLAYSSVDNVAIVLMGLGMALLGRATDRAEIVALGVGAAIWHVWNHALFKSLLFFVAGAVIHATGTGRLDRLGGLARSMPMTSVAALVGGLALAGLPPLNGFLSEFALYVGLAHLGVMGAWPAVAAPALAIAGALTLAAVLKVYGGAFLGEARSAVDPHDPPAPMRFAMSLAAAGCVAMVLGAAAVPPLLDRVVAEFTAGPAPELASLLPTGWISALGVLLSIGILGGTLWLRRRSSGPASRVVGTWDCGYAAAAARVQYTPGSLSASIAELFDTVIRPLRTAPALDGAFPRPSGFSESVPDPVLDRVALPALTRAAGSLTWMRMLQQGRVQAYVLYILVATLALLWLA